MVNSQNRLVVYFYFEGIYLGQGKVCRLRTPMECEPSSEEPGVEVVQLNEFLGGSDEWRLYR